MVIFMTNENGIKMNKEVVLVLSKGILGGILIAFLKRFYWI